jgi:transposase
MPKKCTLPCCASPQKALPVAKVSKKSKKKLKFPYLTTAEKQSIVTLHNIGHTFKEIAMIAGCDRKTASRVVKQFKETESFSPKAKSGRPKKINAEKEAEIIALIEENRQRTSPEILTIMQERDPEFKVHPDHISSILRKHDYNGRVCSKKPLLRPANKVKRMRFARKHVNKPKQFWRSILFSDEKKVELFNSKRRKYCRRKTGEPLRDDTIQPTVKHGGGSLMVWGCFMGGRTGSLFRIEGILKAPQMKKILEEHAIPSGFRLGGNSFVFQQDNDPKHTSKIYMQKFRANQS